VNILALDTAAAVCSIALSSGKENWYFEIDAGQRHSELLMEAVDMLMKIAGMAAGDLDAVACMKGPGSFTGLRIGFSAAKGLCLSLGIPLITIPTLDCIAFSSRVWQGVVMPALDAKKSCYFTALYREGRRISDYRDATLDDITNLLETHKHEKILLTGHSADMLKKDLAGAAGMDIYTDPAMKKGRAGELIELVKIEIGKNGVENCAEEVFAGPLYLRKSDAELQQEA
jgi:tRNA threonylcarbamoyladenosine biosynthesis protein TsaB